VLDPVDVGDDRDALSGVSSRPSRVWSPCSTPSSTSSVREYTFEFDVTAWGWIHLLLGAGVAVAGAFLYLGATWARWTAILLVGLSMLTNFMWLPYYPIWGLVILALDVAVVWAIVSTD
jgi:hypothetical protein